MYVLSKVANCLYVLSFVKAATFVLTEKREVCILTCVRYATHRTIIQPDAQDVNRKNEKTFVFFSRMFAGDESSGESRWHTACSGDSSITKEVYKNTDSENSDLKSLLAIFDNIDQRYGADLFIRTSMLF